MRYLYRIKNLINGKCYIGQTKDYEQRIKTHISRNISTLIHNAIQKYGKENFSFKCLMECEDNEIDFMEQEAIKICNSLYPNGYNLDSGGCLHKQHHEITKQKIGIANKNMSEENRQKISKRKKGTKHSISAKRKMSEAHTGKKLSEEHKRKIATTNKGKKRSEETKIKISKIVKGRKWSEESKRKMHDTIQKRKLLNKQVNRRQVL